LGRDEPDRVLGQSGSDRVRLDVGDEPVLIFLVDQRFDRRAHTALLMAVYSHALQPCIMCDRRSTCAPRIPSMNAVSAWHTSGKRCAISRTAQLCSRMRVSVGDGDSDSAMYPLSVSIAASARARSENASCSSVGGAA